MSGMKFKRYVGYVGQAEWGTDEDREKLIDVLRGLSYTEAYQPFRDVKELLKVYIREGLPDTHMGIDSVCRDVKKLLDLFLSIELLTGKLRELSYVAEENRPGYLYKMLVERWKEAGYLDD